MGEHSVLMSGSAALGLVFSNFRKFLFDVKVSRGIANILISKSAGRKDSILLMG